MRAFLFVTFVFSSFSFANQNFLFECKPRESSQYVNQFYLDGQASMKDVESRLEVVANVKVAIRFRGKNQATKTLKAVSVKGWATIYPAGEFLEEEFTHIDLIAKNKKVEITALSINFKYPQKFASKLRLKDGNIFFSDCEIK